jgi:hypothetical protein
MANPRGGNLSDPGAGKTPPTNVHLWHVWEDYGVKSIFLMPTSLFEQNRDSLLEFTHFKPEQVVIVEGTPAKREKIMSSKDAVVFIGSFNFFTQTGKPSSPSPSNYDTLKKYHRIDALAVDEWHKGFKGITARRTQALIYYLHTQPIPIFLPLTGTAVDGHLDSVYPLIHALEPRYYLNHKDFLRQHAVYDFWGEKIIRWENVDKVKQILERHCIRHSFEEVHGKDATVIVPQPFAMSKKHFDLYRKFESSGVFETDSGFVECAAGTFTLRQRQLCNCPELLVEKLGCNFGEIELMKDDGFSVNVSAAMQRDMQFVTYAAFHAEQERLATIAERDGARVEIMNGDNTKHHSRIDKAYLAGEIDGLICSAEAVGVGFNWRPTGMMMFYSCDYKDTNIVQGIRRGVREKREIPLLVYMMYYKGTVEEDVLAVVESKMRLANKTDATRQVFNVTEKKRRKQREAGEKGKKLKIGGME